MIVVSPEVLAYMRMLPRLLVAAAAVGAFVAPRGKLRQYLAQPAKTDAAATPLSPGQKLLQPVQLAVAVELLVDLPCRACGRAALGRRLSIEYFLFFALVTLPRAYRFGTYTKRVERPARGAGGAEFGEFLLSVAAAHWVGAWRGYRGWINSNGLFAVRMLGTAVGACAAWTLGRAYDRVVAPERLVTTGPYRFARHPIYTAYLLLFAGGLGALGSPLSVAILLLAAGRSYGARMAAEDKLLEGEFGDAWRNYAAATPWRLWPLVT
jgi:protein-S-isoprenylcysteine O-methyltransferase Ste14